MKTCTDYKALIDSQEELEESQQRELDSHLDGCADCSEYMAELVAASRLLKNLRTCLAVSAQSERAYEALRIRLRESARQVFWALAGAGTCAVAAVAIAARGELTVPGGLIFLTLGVFCVIFAWWSSRKRAVFHPLMRPTQDLFGEWEKILTRRIRVTTVIAGVVAAEIAVGGGLLLLTEVASAGEALPFMLGLALVLGVGVLYTFFQELPQLRRELSLVRENTGE